MGQFAKFAVLGVAGLALTGCAQLGAVGDFAWKATENTANFFYKPVASLLRGSPEQAYVFDDSQAYDVVIYQDPTEVEPQSQESQSQTITSQTTQAVQRSEAFANERAGANSYQVTPLPAIPDISFAKIGGGSKMEDWQACETKAGRYLSWEDGKGYTLDPIFESCMRGKNYALESEIALKDS